MSLEDPFAAFVMSEFHADTVEEIVREEELAAVRGQVECSHPLLAEAFGDGWHDLAKGEACAACGAAI